MDGFTQKIMINVTMIFILNKGIVDHVPLFFSEELFNGVSVHVGAV